MLRVLGRASSINVRKVLWTCDEIGAPYTHEPWGDGDLALSAPEFVALNPNVQVPVIVDDGFVLWESNSICRYLVGRHGRDDLLPLEPPGRARVEQWMDWQATELNPTWGGAFLGLVRRSPAHADPQRIAASAARWNAKMQLLDAHLAGHGEPYVSGARFTLADIVLGVSTNRWLRTPIDRPALPAVQAWYERLCARPAFRPHGPDGPP